MSSSQNESSDEEIVLPWWQNPVNFVAIGLASLILGTGIGYMIGHNNATPDSNRVDIGFLQDMRYHHDQAVQIAYHYLTRTEDPHPRITILAEEILFGQQLESGRMVQFLRDFGAAEVNDTGTAMAWMGMAVPVDEMTGLATDDELQRFAAASGDEAAREFATLMIAHHEGGIHMAEYVIDNGENDDVRKMAESMVKGQSAEVAELEALLEELDAP
jgi:uncharacterized protein (DUF305 family)